MKLNFFLLTGFALLSQGISVPAQTDVRRTKNIEQLLTYHARMAASSKEEEEHHVLLRASCEKIMKGLGQLTFISNRNGRVKLQLRGIYTQGPMLYFLFRLNNRSPLDYEIERIRFSIVDPPARGASRTIPPASYAELSPVYQYDSTVLVPGYSRLRNVMVLPRFTLPRGKRLLIEVLEKDGGRHMQITTGNFLLERARII
ncbi:MAG TPA: DUF4138 domain-containing protein [Puia sp.]